ncbi:short chain dehydrogenase/reductase family [Talaromyces proteolyticus]|uniref:Short chain dehydrogenase/reductase family n=1 Tax=Talaromyces proteolyticus TaxID=1131652 RepID=A0AAD4KGT3_9EURO|nr:short chain dehydrogenase/reductase family [Talaromyces proteolyticus]KAH8690785.1 short chain dehydrogenase/reductase family [Talaromyces proteolyticus]
MAENVNNDHFKLSTLFNVKNKVALVTGGGSGIGLMATQALAVNGAKVYIVGRTQDKLNRVAKLYGKDIEGQIIALPAADVSTKEGVEQVHKDFEAREKHLSILINNAGVSSSAREDTQRQDPHGLRETLFDQDAQTVEDWQSVYRANVCQLYFMSSTFLPLLNKGTEIEHGWSSTIINISSISGIVKISQHHFNYNTSKAAAIHLTKMLAHEITSSGLKIRINNIAPGVFPSEMTAHESDEAQKSSLPKERYENKIPAGRPGNDKDMGNAVLYAATNQYVNGQTIVVDGGYVLSTGTI